MGIIKYQFCDGKMCEVEVSEELFLEYQKFIQKEKRNHWKETRRHQSLDLDNDLNVQYISAEADPLCQIIDKEDLLALEKVLTVVP